MFICELTTCVFTTFKMFLGLYEPLRHLKLKNINRNTIRIMWDDIGIPDIRNYIVEMKEGNSDYFYAGKVDNGVQHFDINDLKPDKQYQFRVRTRDAEGFDSLTESEVMKTSEITTGMK